MTTHTIHPSTSHATHAGPPGSDPRENIQAVRRALDSVAEWQQAAEAEAALRIETANRLRAVEAERDGAEREVRGLRRVLAGIQAYVDETNAENRVLRELRADDQVLIAELRARLAAAEAELARSRGRRRHRRRP
jgi:gamma-glutamyl:cysteine ligase YbdK (ATP-grasp superfamily)